MDDSQCVGRVVWLTLSTLAKHALMFPSITGSLSFNPIVVTRASEAVDPGEAVIDLLRQRFA